MSKKSKKEEPKEMSSEEARELLEKAISADEGVRARYYAEIFACLMEYPKFNTFVRDNYVIEQFIDNESGILAVRVNEVGRDGETEEGDENKTAIREDGEE